MLSTKFLSKTYILRMKTVFTISGFFGLTALILDAYGAHGLTTANSHDLEIWQKATQYQLFHAIFLSVLAIISSIRPSIWNFLSAIFTISGVLLFSGGIFLRVLFGNPSFSKITPYGGSLLMMGWLCLICFALFSNTKKHVLK